MTRSDFEIEPFAFREAGPAWEAERRSGAARPRASRATPRRPRPRPVRRWPATIGYIEPAHCCACPAHAPEPVTDGELYEFETLELETPASMPTLRLGSRGSAVVDLQRRLAAAGFSAGAADGIFGSRTDAAVRLFQRARGLKADGVVGPLTWGALLGTPTAPQPAPGTGSPSDPQVTVPSGVLISDNAVRVLKGILRAAGLTRATVTSGRRTSSEQARIMYKLIERNGVSYAKNLYASSGDAVIDEYAAAKGGRQEFDRHQARDGDEDQTTGLPERVTSLQRQLRCVRRRALVHQRRCRFQARARFSGVERCNQDVSLATGGSGVPHRDRAHVKSYVKSQIPSPNSQGKPVEGAG